MSTPLTTHDTAAMDGTPLGLRLRDVTLEVGDGAGKVRAMDAVSLAVAPGELVAVVGPSGAGKSSLLAVAGALATPTSGDVQVLGEDLGAMRRRGEGALAQFRRQRLGFVFQSGNLVPALTAADQLRVAYRIAGRPGARSFDPLPLLDAVGMSHRADHRPGSSPAVSASVWGSLAPSSTTPVCSSSTSRRPRWTASAATRSSSCSLPAVTSGGSPSSWSPTTTTSSPTATGSSR